MISIANQRGVGLVEVLVALLILAIAILGFSALQLRAMGATLEATERSNAMNLARDLAERMRINKKAMADYQSAINSKSFETGCEYKSSTAGSPTQITYKPNCNAAKMAKFDVAEIYNKAQKNGQTIVINQCIGSNTLRCIYVAWGKTSITATNLDECVDPNTGTYVVDSRCIVMEAF